MQIDTGKTRRRIENALRQRGSDEELLRELAGMLGVEVEVLPEPPRCHCCDDGRRPYFGDDQVRCMCQLVVGKTYYAVHLQNKVTRFTVLRAPYEKNDVWWVDVCQTYLNESDFVSNTKRALNDSSVVPYDNGDWADKNHFLFAEESRPCHSHCEESRPCCSHCSSGRRRTLNPLSWKGGDKHSHCCHHHCC